MRCQEAQSSSFSLAPHPSWTPPPLATDHRPETQAAPKPCRWKSSCGSPVAATAAETSFSCLPPLHSSSSSCSHPGCRGVTEALDFGFGFEIHFSLMGTFCSGCHRRTGSTRPWLATRVVTTQRASAAPPPPSNPPKRLSLFSLPSLWFRVSHTHRRVLSLPTVDVCAFSQCKSCSRRRNEFCRKKLFLTRLIAILGVFI